jgi:hypothetical protein
VTTSIGVRAAHDILLFACRVFACLGIAGVLLWCAGRALFDLSGPQPGDAAGLHLYVDVALAWAVGAAVTALVGSAARPGRGKAEALTWAVCSDLGMLLAVLWPLQALIITVLFAVRAGGRARWQRVGAALAGAALLVAGATWGLACHLAEQPWAPRDPADRALVGTWTGIDGRVLELQPDGRYRTNFIGEDPNRIWETRPPVYLSGRWTRTGTSGQEQSIVLNGSTTMEVFGASSPSMLCEPEESRPPHAPAGRPRPQAASALRRRAQPTAGTMAALAAAKRTASPAQPTVPWPMTAVVMSTGPSIIAAEKPVLKTPWYSPCAPSSARS